MYPWTLGGLLLCWCKCFFPWFCHDYWLELEPEYWNLFKYVVTSPEDHEALKEKEPRRNIKQLCWEKARQNTKQHKQNETNSTPKIVQWIHKEELIRLLDYHKSESGTWRTSRPFCWELPWKCIVIFTMKNKYGRYYYTIVDVSTLEHVDGAERGRNDWRNILLQVLKKHKPLRMYVTNGGPFDVLNKDYYMTASICGFLEMYLQIETKLEELLLERVWPSHLAKVKYILENFERKEYYSQNMDSVSFDTFKLNFVHAENTLPTKLTFFEKIEKIPEKWVYDELEIFKKWKNDQTAYEKQKWGSNVLQMAEDRFRLKTSILSNKVILKNDQYIADEIKSETSDITQDNEGRMQWLTIRDFLKAMNRQKYTMKNGSYNLSKRSMIRRTYSEYLWKREKYLSEVEKTSSYFPKVLNFKFSEDEDSFLLNCSKEEVDIYLKYRRYWANWKPLLIFDDDGTLYNDPANELIKKAHQKEMEARYEQEIDKLKKMPKTKRGVLYSEVGLPKHLQNLHFRLKRKVKKVATTQIWKEHLKRFLYGEDHEIEAYNYWKERREFIRKNKYFDWVNRNIERRKYTSGLEWLQYKYPNIFIEVNENLKDEMNGNFLSENSTEVPTKFQGYGATELKMDYYGHVSGKTFKLLLKYDPQVQEPSDVKNLYRQSINTAELISLKKRK